ncbi:conserved hypothetical protein [Burkholderia diffusa]|nr:conserved hypothetical protein [Burkholderia diffusa]
MPQTFAFSFVLLSVPTNVRHGTHQTFMHLIFIGFFRTHRTRQHPSPYIPHIFNFLTIEYINTRCINHLLTLRTLHLSLFVNLKIAPQINSAHQF